MNGQLFYKDENGAYKSLLPITEIVDLAEHESKPSQINDILWHLKHFGSITSLEAIKSYNATRLSGIIYVLRKRGYIIDTVQEKGKTRHDRPSKWARYVYKGRVSSENRSN